MLASCQKLILYSWIDVDAAPLEYCFAGQTTINAVIRTYSDHSCSCQTGVLEHPPAVIIVIAIKKMARSRHAAIDSDTAPTDRSSFYYAVSAAKIKATAAVTGNVLFQTPIIGPI